MKKGIKLIIVILLMLLCNILLETDKDDLDLSIYSDYDSQSEVIFLDLEWNIMKNPVLKNNDDLIAIVPPGDYVLKSSVVEDLNMVNAKPGFKFSSMQDYLFNQLEDSNGIEFKDAYISTEDGYGKIALEFIRMEGEYEFNKNDEFIVYYVHDEKNMFLNTKYWIKKIFIENTGL